MDVRLSGGVICVLCLVQPAVWECVTELQGNAIDVLMDDTDKITVRNIVMTTARTLHVMLELDTAHV